MIPRTPTTPHEVTDEWLATAWQGLVEAGLALLAGAPQVQQAALAAMWVQWQVELGGVAEPVARQIAQSVIAVTRQTAGDPWQIAEATLDAVRRNPPPKGKNVQLFVFASPAEKPNESEGF